MGMNELLAKLGDDVDDSEFADDNDAPATPAPAKKVKKKIKKKIKRKRPAGAEKAPPQKAETEQ